MRVSFFARHILELADAQVRMHVGTYAHTSFA